MIQSILDTDLYKFSTSYAYMKLYPEAEGTFSFTDRNKTVYDDEFVEALDMEIAKLCMLRLSDPEFEYASTAIPYIHLNYWEWLKQFHFEFDKINVFLDEDRHLHIEVTDRMYKVTLYEVPILAIVAELSNKKHINDFSKTIEKLDAKIAIANEEGFKFSEFGTRRRYSSTLQEHVIARLKEKCPGCVGTSNVYYAMKFNMKPIGTFPHEWVMFHAATGGYKKANYNMLEAWSDVYNGNLGTALIDTLTTEVFLRDFSLKHAKLFDGVRQDSGDEYKIGNMIIDAYKKRGIDPTTKSLIFSNALDFDKYRDINRYFRGRIRCSAGIGTNLTNDPAIENYKPANIVMKLSKCRMTPREAWQDCIKLSDDLGKHMGPEREVEIAMHELGISN